MSFADRLKLLRKERNWSQKELADRVGIGEAQHISRYEKGKVSPSLDMLIKLAEVLDISLDYLLNGKKTDEDPLINKKDQFCFSQIKKLDEVDRILIESLVDAILKKNLRIKQLSEKNAEN